MGGLWTSYRDIDNITVGPGATLTMLQDTTVDAAAWIDGTFEHVSTGTIAAITVGPRGIARASSGRHGSSPGFTVTSSEKYAGGQLFEDDPGITWSAEPALIGRGRR
jgi:hypothetical protein